VPEHRDWHNMHKDYGIEIEMIWDPDGVDETFRRLSGNSYVPEVNLRKSFVGDGNKKIRVIIRNRSHDDDDLIVSSWFLGYTQ
jgi:alkyl hydroperoxide reductase subunit AhpC